MLFSRRSPLRIAAEPCRRGGFDLVLDGRISLDAPISNGGNRVSGRTRRFACCSTIAFTLLWALQPTWAAGEADLAAAARNRDSAGVRTLLRQQPDVNKRLG